MNGKPTPGAGDGLFFRPRYALPFAQECLYFTLREQGPAGPVCLPFGGALVSTGMLKPKWQAEAPLAS